VKKRILVLAVIGALFPAVALGAAAKTVVKATLAGASEVPKGSPTGKGTATITLAGNKVCWTLTFTGIGTPAASHIHKGKPGTAGPVVVPLGGAFKAKGCTTASAALVRAIGRTPGAYYVNIHTAKFPGGAIRGQLHR
jgi:hypothetical protein